MNKNIIKGNWTELKGKVKQQWGKLTDNDVTKLNGSYEELSGLLQKSYGYQQEEADKQIKEFIEKCGCKDKTS